MPVKPQPLGVEAGGFLINKTKQTKQEKSKAEWVRCCYPLAAGLGDVPGVCWAHSDGIWCAFCHFTVKYNLHCIGRYENMHISRMMMDVFMKKTLWGWRDDGSAFLIKSIDWLTHCLYMNVFYTCMCERWAPSTYIRHLTTACNSGSREFQHHWLPGTWTHMHISYPPEMQTDI